MDRWSLSPKSGEASAHTHVNQRRAKSGERGAAARAEHVLSIMEQRYRDGDRDFKPNTRTLTSVIDAHAKSGEKGAARRAELILNNMISRYDTTGDPDSKPNVHTANAVCNVSDTSLQR